VCFPRVYNVHKLAVPLHPDVFGRHLKRLHCWNVKGQHIFLVLFFFSSFFFAPLFSLLYPLYRRLFVTRRNFTLISHPHAVTKYHFYSYTSNMFLFVNYFSWCNYRIRRIMSFVAITRYYNNTIIYYLYRQLKYAWVYKILHWKFVLR